jgi:hypothetical protein
MSRNMFTHDPDPGDYFESQCDTITHLKKQLAERDAQLKTLEEANLYLSQDVRDYRAKLKITIEALENIKWSFKEDFGRGIVHFCDEALKQIELSGDKKCQ